MTATSPAQTKGARAATFDADEMFGDNDYLVQGCNPAGEWTIAGGIDEAGFATIAVTPSLDGCVFGIWHGGEIR